MVFDIILIGIIVLCAFIGYKQGLLKSLIKILSFFIAIIIALVLYKPVSTIVINNTNIDDNIKNGIVQNMKISEKQGENTQNKTLKDQIQNKIVGTTEVAIEEAADIITVKIVRIGTLLSIFLILRIVLIIITLVTDLISKLPVINQANKLGGVIFGILKGIVIVYSILTVLYFITPLISADVTVTINKSIITKIIYNNNFILNLFI